MSVSRDHYVRVGPISARYWVEGDGTPVVLVHGLGGSAAGWLLSFDAFAAQHRVFEAGSDRKLRAHTDVRSTQNIQPVSA